MCGSAVGLLAVEHAGDLDGVAFVVEEDAVILGAEAEQRRFVAAKLFSVALAPLEKWARVLSTCKAGSRSMARMSALA